MKGLYIHVNNALIRQKEKRTLKYTLCPNTQQYISAVMKNTVHMRHTVKNCWRNMLNQNTRELWNINVNTWIAFIWRKEGVLWKNKNILYMRVGDADNVNWRSKIEVNLESTCSKSIQTEYIKTWHYELYARVNISIVILQEKI